MSRIMAIDYGDARIGIALTDPLKIISSGYKTLQNKVNVFSEILDICKTKDVESIVIGIPFNQDSKIGDSAKKVLLFVNKMLDFFKNNNFSIPIYEQDERYSTQNAIESMREIKVKKDKKKQVVDQIAAANILYNFMQTSKKILIEDTLTQFTE
jgi:putative Holliday junction resolvase